MRLLSNVPIIQPLIDFFEGILKFFHDTVGLGWGFSIIALTILVRACLISKRVRRGSGYQPLPVVAARQRCP